MITLSLCMIVRDEEDVLGRCLDSVKDAVDEIIIIDTGSEDRTKETALKYTQNVYDFPWRDDFSAARNFALEHGTMDYLMWMDADDVLPAESRRKLIRLKETLGADVDMVMMPYAAAFEPSGKTAFSYYRERIVKNRRGFRFFGRVHEVIPPSGRICYEEIPVEHRKLKEGDSERNLRVYQDMEKAGEMFDSRALYYYGRELYFHGKYRKGREVLEQFLERPDGWVENKIDATRQLAGCLYGIGDDMGALKALLQALEYDVPRGETCCDLGRHFQDREQYEQAVYWYRQAFGAKKDLTSGAFISEECYGFLPAISLCVCYDWLGDRKKAEQYNELAGSYRPDSRYYLKNKEYFAAQRMKKGL